MTQWVYIIHSEITGRFYCGQSFKPEQRLLQHNDPDDQLSKTTKRFKGPWKLIWTRPCVDKSEATILERRIKKNGISRFLKREKVGRVPPAAGLTDLVGHAFSVIQGSQNHMGPRCKARAFLLHNVGFISYKARRAADTIVAIQVNRAVAFANTTTLFTHPSKTTKHFQEPWKLVYSKACGNRSEVMVLEKKIKKRNSQVFICCSAGWFPM